MNDVASGGPDRADPDRADPNWADPDWIDPRWADPRVDAILGIVAKETGVARERLLPEATIDALGIASLDMVQTIFALESQYDIEIPVVSDQAGAEFATVGSLVSHVLVTLDRVAPADVASTGAA